MLTRIVTSYIINNIGKIRDVLILSLLLRPYT